MNLPSFCGGSYQSQSSLADNEITMNFYPENTESSGATSKMCLYPTPGVIQVGEVPIFPGYAGRAHFATEDREFAVVGPSLMEIDQFGTATFRGVVALGGNATISYNGKAGDQLFITGGTNAYIFTLSTNVYTQIVALNGLATMGDQIDGYFLALDANTSTMYFSDLNNGLVWQTGIKFIKRSLASDGWVSLKVANRLIWLFGSVTSEPWYNAGLFPVPFLPYVSSVIAYGCGAPFSPVVSNGSLLWVGPNRNVLQSLGVNPTVISTYALSNTLTGYSTLEDGVGDAYTSRGHSFFLLSFPTANKTICYDVNTQLWHDRGTWISETSEFIAWRPRYHVEVFGQHRMLDSSNGDLYKMDETYPLDVDERAIRRVRRSPCLYRENQRIFVDAFELEMEIGLGNTVPPGDDPQVMMRQSYDGGKTFGSELWRSAGKIGEYGKRVRWNRCGAGRRRVFEVSVTDSVPWRIMGATAEIRQAPQGVRKFGQQAQQ